MLIDLVMKQWSIYERVNNSFIQIDKKKNIWWNIDFFFLGRLHRMWYNQDLYKKKNKKKNFLNSEMLQL